MRDTPSCSILVGNFILWSCVLCTFTMVSILLGNLKQHILNLNINSDYFFSADSKLYVFWSGNPKIDLKKPDSHIILIVATFILLLTLDLMTFFLYKKIERLKSSEETKMIKEFDNIMEVSKRKLFVHVNI